VNRPIQWQLLPPSDDDFQLQSHPATSTLIDSPLLVDRV